MECNNGQKYPIPADIFRREIEWKCRSAYARGTQLAFGTKLSYPFPAQTMRIHPFYLPLFPPMPPTAHKEESDPFMNMMEEISYWVTTKRAPCLYNYDNVIKRQNEQAHCSRDALKTTPSIEVPHPKNKKRKLKLLEDSESSEKQQNLFFEKTVNKDAKTPKSVRSDSLASKIDFKIKSVTQSKPKRSKMQKKTKDLPPKASKVSTSTPKFSNVRRSLRRAQQSNNNYGQLNDSFEILNASAIAAEDKLEIKLEDTKKINTSGIVKTETNGKYEDSSDVSGFTANYIRSTKVHSSKATNKVQNKGSRSQAKHKKTTNVHDNIIMCVNKSVNTVEANPVLNCSTDSSQNIINLVTVQNESTNKLNKSTSLLKFVNVKSDQEHTPEKKINRHKNMNYDTSFQSKSSNTSRYPKRQRKISMADSEKDIYRVDTPEKTLPKSCTTKESKSERKENSVSVLSRTRSGRKIGSNQHPETSGCATFVINNSSEQVSSSVTLNVGRQKTRKVNYGTMCLRNKTYKNITKTDSLSDKSEKNEVGESSCNKLRSTRRTRHVKKVSNESGDVTRKDSLRDKSGFAYCFSDSDSDNEPLKHRKYFY